MARRLMDPYFTVLDSNGDPVSGALLNAYESGTTTRLDTFSDEGLTSANANPVVADAAGRFGEIWLKEQDYKVVITDASGVTIKTIDPIKGAFTISGDDFKVSQQSPADLTVQVSAGTLYDLTTKARVSKAVQNSGAVTAPTTNPRFDIVHIDQLSGVIGITTGAEAASPSDPTLADGLLPLARLSLATTTTEITSTEITDIRELANIGQAVYGADASEVALNDQDWTAIASAGTVNIGAAATERVNITGTTTITAFDTVGAGIAREVRFDGALTLTHNATSLILPGGANITTAAGDTAKFVSEGSGNWRCLWYVQADGTPVINPTVAFTDVSTLETEQATTSGTAKDFTSIPSGTRIIIVSWDGVGWTSAQDLLIQIGDSGGIEATGYIGTHFNIANAGAAAVVNLSTGFPLVHNSTAGGNSISGMLILSRIDSGGLTWAAMGNGGSVQTVDEFSAVGGYKTLSAELDRVRFTSVSAGTFTAGSVNITYM